MTKAQKTKKTRAVVEPVSVAKSEAESLQAAPKTKQTTLIDLLNREEGATIDALTLATGWQKHSVRGFISGTLKKKLGLMVASDPDPDRGRVYRIVPQGLGVSAGDA